MNDNLASLCKHAADLVLSFPKSTRMRVVSHYDADGITSAGIICSAVYAKGYDFHVTLMRNPFTKGFDRLKNENNDLIVFSDMGSGQIDDIEQLNCPVIILDHHQHIRTETQKKVIQINANLCGIDGNYEACGASLSYAFAIALDPRNEMLAPLAIAGMMGDKQYIGGIRGYNREIVESAVNKGIVKKTIGVKLSGGTLAESLSFSIDPYYKGLSGKDEEVKNTLKKLNIDSSIKIEDLDEKQRKTLHSYLLYLLVKNGCQKNIIDIAIRERYSSEKFGELEQFADLLDACGKNGARSLGLSLCLGDTKTFHEAKTVEKDYKQKILSSLLALENDGIHEMNSFRYFYSDDSSLGGVIGGVAVNYIFDEKKALFSLARKDDEIHVSCRGNQMLVKKGLDLGSAMKTIGEELSGHGGGHKIAAGATIGINHEKEFLEKVDALLSHQLKVNA